MNSFKPCLLAGLVALQYLPKELKTMDKFDEMTFKTEIDFNQFEYFCPIYAMTRLGAPKMAKIHRTVAKQMPTEEEYIDRIKHLDSKFAQ